MKKSSILLGVLSLALIISILFTTIQYCNILSLENDMESLQYEISQLNQATVDRDTIITWLDTALYLAESRTNLNLPNATKYLETFPNQNGEEKTTKIFLISTAAGYHYFHTMEFATDLFKLKFVSNWSRGMLNLTENRSILLSRWGWTFDAGGLSAGNYEYQIGTYAQNPVLIIGATINSDYSSVDFEAVGNRTGKYVSSINLAVRFFSQNGSLIEFSSINDAWTSSRTGVGGVSFLLEAGQSKQVIFYCSPSSLDIDHYEIYVSSLVPY
ncbi:MAG: hypothetical protein P8Y18_00570 [Candidatus Bathyarchaeota archaeon]